MFHSVFTAKSDSIKMLTVLLYTLVMYRITLMKGFEDGRSSVQVPL